MSEIVQITPPTPDEFHEYYATYINKVGGNVLDEFKSQPKELKQLVGNLPVEECSRLHEPYTWTLKQVVGHLIDCERTFGNRLYRIAYGDPAPIPGIDQNLYVDNMDYEAVSMNALIKEFRHLRKANVLMISRLNPALLENEGVASDNPVTAKANLFILVGHFTYHMEIIKKRLQGSGASPD